MSNVRFLVLHIFLYFSFFHFGDSEVLERVFNEASTCTTNCEEHFPEQRETELRKACDEGCRLFTLIDLSRDLRDHNKTTRLCKLACAEAFMNVSVEIACNRGCDSYPVTSEISEEEDEFGPLLFVRGAMARVRSVVSWTVYVRSDDSGVVVMETGPKIVSVSGGSDAGGVPSEASESARVDWMECLSSQAGVPRAVLVGVLFAFSVVLLWLCCAAATTAPTQYVRAGKKRDTGYVLICEPIGGSPLKVAPPVYGDLEAPPLPTKVSLI